MARAGELIRRVVQDQREGWFLGPDGWTDNPDLAISFESAEEAVRECEVRKLRNADLVLSFESDQFNIHLPVC
ncbi:MAG TPA: hypothetical protein PLH97_03340 [Verrucomicrobiota bacterium]|nr:hypothetical protein [Verrucomicrobiota bacterium]